MPEKSLSVATYAAGAGLAAVTLIYVFAPTYFIDSDSNASRKKGAVGLANPANDCFINSVLQALAGLGDLRKYLIREVHRRSLDEQWVYNQPVNSHETRKMHDVKVIGLQLGLVTKGLKDMLDSLNERPPYKKTITTTTFIRVLEHAFHQRISRQQQDAQEFLQIVAERLCEEYHAGQRARIAARNAASLEGGSDDGAAPPQSPEVSVLRDDAQGGGGPSPTNSSASVPTIHTTNLGGNQDESEEEGFPMEGAFQSQIECMTCHFKPRPKESKFCTLTLNVPQASSTTLNACFDVMFKKEDIEDWKCEKCRLQHALEEYRKLVQNATPSDDLSALQSAVDRLQTAIDIDPESPPEGVRLPDGRHAPSRKIERHTYITKFPKILAVHLSRSIYSSYSSQKNSAKVAFPEALKVGSLSQGMKNYKLLGVVTHKGNHYSGHYESFRRQNVAAPFSTPNTFQRSGVYSRAASPVSTPKIKALKKTDSGSPLASTPDLLSPEESNNPSSLSQETDLAALRASVDTAQGSINGRPSSSRLNQIKDEETSSIRSVAASAKSTLSKFSLPRSAGDRSPSPKADQTVTAKVPKRKKKRNDKWWRISDEKVKEARTSEVLGMQREVYLLFYELDLPDDDQ